MTLPLQRPLLRTTDVSPPPPPIATTDPAEDDLRLLRSGQAGSRDAWATLLRRHETALYRLCRGMSASDADAEDLVQETFLRALRAFDRPGGFRAQSSVQTFLYRIAVNVCLDARRQARPTSNLDALGETLPSRSAAPEQTIIARAAVRDALAQLQPRQRVLLLLREQEGLSVAEIALTLGWNVKKVDNELYKTRKALAAWRERSED